MSQNQRDGLNRRSFLAVTAATPFALSACTTSNPSGVVPPAPSPPAPLLPAGIGVTDLRFGFSPTPPKFPGYDPAGDAKALIAAGTPSPAQSPVPGTLATGSYAPNQRYVIKVPQNWNGKLIVAGTPSFRSEFANDAIWGDYMLAQGYAFASSNKGIGYNAVLETVANSLNPKAAYPIPFDLFKLETNMQTLRFGAVAQSTNIASWNDDFATLTRAAQRFLAQYFGRAFKTYAVGLSNGGAQVRSLLEQHGDLVDGGVDWSGVFWSPALNILTYMPKFLAAMPAYIASNFTDAGAAQAIAAAGYPTDILQAAAAHPSLWFEYYANQPSFYTDLTLWAYALICDPQTSSSIASPGCTPNGSDPVRLPGTCNATGLAVPANRQTYATSSAAAAVIAKFTHTGRITKPLVSIAGAADMFITAQNNATPYLNAVNAAAGATPYFQYLVSGGTHVDTFAPFGYGLQPQLPFAWAAFEQVVAIVERGFSPGGSGAAQAVMTPSQIRSS